MGDLIVNECLKWVGGRVALFLAGVMVGTFLGNVWFHLQTGGL